MKKICIFIFLICFLFTCKTAYCAPIEYELGQGKSPVIIDNADLISDYDIVSASDRLTAIRESEGYQFIIITTTETNDYVKGREVQTLFNQRRAELHGSGAVLFLISTNPDHPICELQAYNQANNVLTKDICSYINESLLPLYNDGKYAECIDTLIDYIEEAVKGELVIETSDAGPDKGFNYILAILASVFITLIIDVVIFLVSSGKSSNEMKKINDSDEHIIGDIKYDFQVISDHVNYIRSHKTN